jgi:predicted transcriptional regulator
MYDMGDMLSIRIQPALRRQLDRLCRRQNRPASDIAREALRRYMAAEELRQLRAGLRPHAEARGFVTDEDVFKAVS